MNKNKRMLSPKIDVVFHMLFGEQKHERITKKLIEDVIEEKVETIELEQTPYLWGEQAEDKVGIIDVRATINNKNPIDIEMQIADNKNIEKRILFYWSRLYLKQLKEGESYKKLNRSISIIFLDYKIDNLKDLPIHTKWQIKNNENCKVILTEDLEIHIIELPKIKEKMEEGSLKKWILFLENPEGEETKKMAEKEKEIKEAIETLEDISSDEIKIRIAELREKYIMDRESELETAEQKGIYKGKREVAKKMKEKGILIEDIMEITKLTKEEIEEL
jgi:predicted transposase/invertase (TIGR01784 family)